MRYLPKDNLDYPVLLVWDTGICGSGFYVNAHEKVYLVTARHVLYQENDDMIFLGQKLTIYSYKDEIIDPLVTSLDISMFPKENAKKSSSTDVAIVCIGELRKYKDTNRKTVHWWPGYDVVSSPTNHSGLRGAPNEMFKFFKDVEIGNDVVIFGYPISLGSSGEIEPQRPLLRRGCVAGKNYIKNTIILDCPVYQGNSGGLALQIEQLGAGRFQANVIGVVSKFVPFKETFESKNFGYSNTSIENSGYSIVTPIDSVRDLINAHHGATTTTIAPSNPRPVVREVPPSSSAQP